MYPHCRFFPDIYLTNLEIAPILNWSDHLLSLSPGHKVTKGKEGEEVLLPRISVFFC
jgi:hypothetical protein